MSHPEQAPDGRAMNRAGYDAIAPSWDQARADFYGREREYIDTLLDGLPTGARVLDLGCGTGRPIAAQVLAKGYRVTGVDQSRALIAIARGRCPAAEWIEDTIESFAASTPAAHYRALICWDALFHIDRREHATLFAHFATLLATGGRIMLTFGGSEHPPFTDTMYGHTFFYDSHNPERTLALLAEAGFAPIISEFMNPPTSGRDKGRYAVVARLA